MAYPLRWLFTIRVYYADNNRLSFIELTVPWPPVGLSTGPHPRPTEESDVLALQPWLASPGSYKDCALFAYVSGGLSDQDISSIQSGPLIKCYDP